MSMHFFFFYAEERNYLHFFQKVDFKSTNEMWK